MMRALKIATQKKQPISILRSEKYLYETSFTLLKPDIVHEKVQQLLKLKYRFFEKLL